MIHVSYKRGDGFAVLTAQGDLSLRTVVLALQSWLAHADYSAQTNLLCDVRQAGWQQAVAEFLPIAAAVIERVNQQWQGTKVAIVAGSHTEVALIETHLSLLGWQAQWIGFTSFEQAEDWLAAPPSEVRGAN